jgi:hypothetical protein
VSAPRGSRYGCVLGFRGLQITVSSSHAAPLHWLVEFLSPHLASDTEGPRHRNVTVIVDRARYARLLVNRGARSREHMDCFVLDGAFQPLMLWREDPDGRLLHDPGAEVFVWVSGGRGDIEIVARADRARMRVALMRVIRELAMLQSLHRGDLFVHAAAAVLGDRAIVIAGQKRAGKTTMLLDLLHRTRASYLSNDRVMVDASTDPPVVHGVPTIVKIRAESLQFVPSLTEPALGYPHRHYLTVRECADGSPLLEPPSRHPASMSPPQLCRWLDAEPIAAAPLGAIVFPAVDPTVTRFEVRQLGAPEAAARIRESLFSAGPNGLVSEVFGPDWDGEFPARDHVMDVCRRLAECCSAYECRLGPDAHRTSGVWDSLA